jgi:hypothetical protein
MSIDNALVVSTVDPLILDWRMVVKREYPQSLYFILTGILCTSHESQAFMYLLSIPLPRNLTLCVSCFTFYSPRMSTLQPTLQPTLWV